MWVVCRLSVFCEHFTDRAFGFPYILFFTFFTFNHICNVKDIEQRNSFLIRSIINYFVCLVTIVVTMFICFPIGL